jgi:CheY-like chemotaxis protein
MLDSLIERIEIVDQTLKQNTILKKTINEIDTIAVKDIESQKILIVDDDKPLADTFKLILEGVGYHVEAAETGSQALEKINQRDFDWVLLDLNLPDMLGDVVAEKIEKKCEKTSIIFITGYPMLKERVESLQNDKKILLKPIVPEELIDITTQKDLEQPEDT